MYMFSISKKLNKVAASFDNWLQLYDKSSHFKVELVGQNKNRFALVQ